MSRKPNLVRVQRVLPDREARRPTWRFAPLGGWLITALVLAACASTKPPPPKLNLSGFPPAFRDGYTDGCHSASPGAFKRRDEPRYAQDTQYASGWRDGFDVCRKRRPR